MKEFESEKENINVARKSILSKIKIRKGDIFTKNNLCIKILNNGSITFEGLLIRRNNL
jgi:sialic acid synthase SpsE